MLDIVIRDGMIIDGSGSSAVPGDVLVHQGRIIDTGSIGQVDAERTIDASGSVVAPGFIDMHSHADFSLPVCPTAESLVHQGITSTVIGQCGISTSPLLEETREEVSSAWDLLGVAFPWEKWSSLKTYLEYLIEIGISLNVVPLVGQGTIRADIMGFTSDQASEVELARMHDLLDLRMDHGAIGVSSGLIYPPGSYTTTEELIEFTRPAGMRNGYYFSHIRGEGETLLEAISEAIEIGFETKTRVQISHLKAAGKKNWGKMEQALHLIEKAQSGGLDVTADMYTYPAGSTGLRSLLPEWSLEGGVGLAIERLVVSATREKMEEEMKVTGFCSDVEFDQVYISSSPDKREIEGNYIADLADSADKSPYDWIFDTLHETKMNVMMVNFMMSEENIKMGLQHPAVMIGTDSFGLAVEGPLSKGKPHPRCYGTYPRLLGHYVREQKTLTLEEAIRKSSGFPAQKLGWTDRGLIKKGHWADIVVFDPDTIKDSSTYQDPHQYPDGISHVIVNGGIVLDDGSHNGSRPGKAL